MWGDVMSAVSAAIIGAALAMDAFAVSFVCGSSDRTKRLRCAFITAAAFGIFQMIMPILGWSVGKVGSKAIEGFDHIIAFGILVFLGVKMIIDSFGNIMDKKSDVFDLRSLIIMALATSIDALTVGIVLPSAVGAETFTSLIMSVSIIGAVTFILCFIGYQLGRRISNLNPRITQIIGGIVLIALGIKSLITG